jgi:hypothetical protein
VLRGEKIRISDAIGSHGNGLEHRFSGTAVSSNFEQWRKLVGTVGTMSRPD